MDPSTSSRILFRPLMVAGIIIVAFGVTCIWVGSAIELKEEGAGFTIIGWRFLVSGLVAILFAYIAKYFEFVSGHLKFMLKQIRYRTNPRKNRFSDWYKP
jgi:hypothetical protein